MAKDKCQLQPSVVLLTFTQ